MFKQEKKKINKPYRTKSLERERKKNPFPFPAPNRK
jgi:hypothetical protein